MSVIKGIGKFFYILLQFILAMLPILVVLLIAGLIFKNQETMQIINTVINFFKGW